MKNISSIVQQRIIVFSLVTPPIKNRHSRRNYDDFRKVEGPAREPLETGTHFPGCRLELILDRQQPVESS